MTESYEISKWAICSIKDAGALKTYLLLHTLVDPQTREITAPAPKLAVLLQISTSALTRHLRYLAKAGAVVSRRNQPSHGPRRANTIFLPFAQPEKAAK